MVNVTEEELDLINYVAHHSPAGWSEPWLRQLIYLEIARCSEFDEKIKEKSDQLGGFSFWKKNQNGSFSYE